MEEDKVSLLGQLSIQCIEDSIRWFGDSALHDNVPYLALAMCGEAGEFANVVKKIQRGSLDPNSPETRVRLAEELTDVFVYMLNIAATLDIDLLKMYEIVRAKNEIRFTMQREEREAKTQ
jgi:NTP pyrophosphatase (non-canonical NTP hydrolase)